MILETFLMKKYTKTMFVHIGRKTKVENEKKGPTRGNWSTGVVKQKGIMMRAKYEFLLVRSVFISYIVN